MTSDYNVRLRPLEREDLRFVHQLDNNASVMRYWFEEPYEAFVELSVSMTNTSTIKASGALSSNATAKTPGWWNWLKLTMCIVGLNFRLLFRRSTRGKVWRHARPNWRWITDLPYSISINCI